jgi:hypothetical protein
VNSIGLTWDHLTGFFGDSAELFQAIKYEKYFEEGVEFHNFTPLVQFSNAWCTK